MQKCGWSHCESGGVIYDTQDKVKVGKRWYHSECACERECINDIITKFTEEVDAQADIKLLRSVINNIIYEECKPAQYVLFAVNYAVNHPVMKLRFPQGLYRICNSTDVLEAWKDKQNKQFMATVDKTKFVAKEVEATPLNRSNVRSGGFSSILGKRSS